MPWAVCGGAQLAPEGKISAVMGDWEGLLNLSALPGSPFLRTPESCRRSPKHPTAPGVVRVPTRHVTCDVASVFAVAGAVAAMLPLALYRSSLASLRTNALNLPQQSGCRAAAGQVQLC